MPVNHPIAHATCNRASGKEAQNYPQILEGLDATRLTINFQPLMLTCVDLDSASILTLANNMDPVIDCSVGLRKSTMLNWHTALWQCFLLSPLTRAGKKIHLSFISAFCFWTSSRNVLPHWLTTLPSFPCSVTQGLLNSQLIGTVNLCPCTLR